MFRRRGRASFLALAALFAAGGVAAGAVARVDARTLVAGRHDRPVPILMYHVIAVPPADADYPELWVRPADFAGQMRWLARHGYHAVTLRRVYDYWRRGHALPSHPIVISFDDGYLSQHRAARPVLRRLHWPGVLNLKVGNLNSDYAFPPWRVRDLIADGWEIDAHTISHVDLTAVGDKELWREVHGSRVELRKRFHIPVDFFCYPSGRYNARVIAAVRRAGYLGATTTKYGLARPPRFYELERVRISRSDGIAGFARKLEDLT